MACPVLERVERNDALDGLRFLAVVAVMAFHFGVPGARAGFLGVDLFFVLSGFLITRVLLNQITRTRVDLVGFWTRRIRRLAPALIVGIAAVIAWGSLAAPATLRDALRDDITATLAYVANWHFISSSSYFAATGVESPLQHMWSLAVEEQFYIAWPIALWLVSRFTKAPRSRILAVGAIATVGILVSAWRLESLWNSTGADRAYMGTDSRIFEPLVGALLAALLVLTPRRGGGRLAHVALLVVGSAGVLWGLLRLDSPSGAATRYSTGGALIVAFGSAAVIWAIATRSSAATRVLAYAPVAYLGRLSYGMYIWHWPLVVWSGRSEWLDMSTWPDVFRVTALTGATIALASLSYHLVETPIRYGNLSAHLNPRRIAVTLPVMLGSLLIVNTLFVVPHGGATQGNVTRTIVLVGDSVPQRLAIDFAHAAGEQRYVVILATRGSCPATGAIVVDANGKPAGGGRACQRDVPRRQDAAVARYRPALVVWWSRYEIADRLSAAGTPLRPGSDAYWLAQQASFGMRAKALTRFGARLVTVQIERSGRGMLTRCTPSKCGQLLHRLLFRTDLQDTWNDFLARHHGRTVFSISINTLVCHDAASPCDDRLPDGSLARPDGTHYSAAAGPRIAERVITAALQVAGLEVARSAPASGSASDSKSHGAHAVGVKRT
jgi:peptidoglycan/LPS O-acetylase OafA/YrhL